MTSTVACIGFTDPGALAAIARDRGSAFHELSSTTSWTDGSGAMLLLDRASVTARPALHTEVRTPYKSLAALESGLAQVLLTDADGTDIEVVTVIPAARYTVGWAAAGHVALVAMGVDTEFFPTAEDFFDSPRSAMPGSEGEPPAEVRQFGLPWPPPMEIESFLPSPTDATATISGTVQRAQVRTNSVTGHEFLVARIATLIGEIDLCSPVPVEGAPAPGSVAVGTVELVATFPPHGLPEDNTYTPQEQVPTTFRDGSLGEVGSAADFVMDPADIALPDGLVLGEDGAVRTLEEHRAWKGAAPSSPEPTATPATPAAAPDTPSPQTGSEPDVAAETSAPASTPIDDSAPRPGETRREWRTRTGRA